MAKIAVRNVLSGAETTMSLSRARDAVAAGQVAYVKAPKAKTKKAVKKTAAKKTARKSTDKSVSGTRTRTMAGRTRSK
jgi:hypothetical protein